MSPALYLFIVIGVVYYALAHQISVLQRTVKSLRDDIHGDVKHEIDLHEIRTR
jgi:hypothetical protein